MYLYEFCSGFLTGKVKKGEKAPEGRMGWVEEDKARTNQAFPSVETMDTDRNWAILEAVQRIAKARGGSVLYRKCE
jgi:aryl-alcohol dehydrogenase-like predicted oxidoreductase